MQKQYGKTEAELEILVEGFVWILGEYDCQVVFEAMKTYVSRKGDIPVPADIMNIINPAPEPKKWCSTTFFDIKRRAREGQFITREEDKYCSDFVQAKVKSSPDERGEIENAIKRVESENKKYWIE